MEIVYEEIDMNGDENDENDDARDIYIDDDDSHITNEIHSKNRKFCTSSDDDDTSIVGKQELCANDNQGSCDSYDSFISDEYDSSDYYPNDTITKKKSQR